MLDSIMKSIQWIINHEKGEIINIDGHNVPFYRHAGSFQPIHEPTFPSAGDVTSLAGFAHYINHNPDNYSYKNMYVIVRSYKEVVLQSAPYGAGQRDHILSAIPTFDSDLNHYRQTEAFLGEFQAFLMTAFTDSGDRDYLLKLCSNVVVGENAQVKDDGIKQEVAVKTGITTVDMTEIKPVVHLAPYRTFPDIDQPLSPFLFRMHQIKAKPDMLKCRLVETGDQTWKLKAHKDIVDFLYKEIQTTTVPVIG